jgi:hypothetical protein
MRPKRIQLFRRKGWRLAAAIVGRLIRKTKCFFGWHDWRGEGSYPGYPTRICAICNLRMGIDLVDIGRQRTWVKLSARKPAPEPTDKLLVILSDGRCALADNDDHARALVAAECLRSGGCVFANFRPATADEVSALSSQNK